MSAAAKGEREKGREVQNFILTSFRTLCIIWVYSLNQKGGNRMKKELFTNEIILSWLQYYADNTPIDLEQIKMMDITKKNKNLIPTVESHKAVLAFMEAGDPDIFYHMWNAGLGECEVWYNEGSEPAGEIKHDKGSNMDHRHIDA